MATSSLKRDLCVFWEYSGANYRFNGYNSNYSEEMSIRSIVELRLLISLNHRLFITSVGSTNLYWISCGCEPPLRSRVFLEAHSSSDSAAFEHLVFLVELAAVS